MPLFSHPFSCYAHRPFVAAATPPDNPEQLAWWFAFVGNRLLIDPRTPSQIPCLISLSEIGLQPLRSQFLGNLAGQGCYEAELPIDTPVPEGMSLVGLREVYGVLDDDLFALSGRAVQIKEWDRTHQFCGHCATSTVQLPNERAKRCPACDLVSYPRLSPAIIVLVSRGEEVLLARAPRFPPTMFSVLAGFVEPGESLEETVIREVREEVGVEVQDICYFGSQPWPFPNSLMIGFTATYAGGDLVLAPDEIAEAGWFHKHNLPQVPSSLSIARQLIDWFAQS